MDNHSQCFRRVFCGSFFLEFEYNGFMNSGSEAETLIQIRPFSELSTEELYEILKARVDVFVVEQNCPYPELDGKDRSAVHFFRKAEDGTILSYLRLYEAGAGMIQIGRVLTRVRGKNYGRQLLHAAVEYAEQHWPDRTVMVEAQTYASGFYEKEGFRVCSEEFLEDGIPHVRMERAA